MATNKRKPNALIVPIDDLRSDELCDLASDPFAMKNLIAKRDAKPLAAPLRGQFAAPVAHSVGL